MSLAIGTRLGPYEIIGALGAGGMGEVYRARDTRLGRDVAIKVLTGHFGATAEIRTRFEREAKTVSQLNHPNICSLFDVGRASGDGGPGDVDYLVMELVEGETLAQRLTRGPLPVAEVLTVGSQIAGALEQAHRAGVIHRDLKPGNVMLTRAGAKLMDFGLARATGLAGGAGASGVTVAMSQSPTMAQPLTAEGTIIGTFQYMSPEQLEGREADARSDIWSLGCVLYEMATGRRAFEGRSQASLISAIMSGEPAPISQVAPMAPPALERVVHACVAKDPEDRIQTAHDVLLQLRWESETRSSVSAGGAPPQVRARAARRGWLPWAVAAAAVVAAVAAWVVRFPASRPERPLRLEVGTPRNIGPTFYSCDVTISPDGNKVAFVGLGQAARSLWVRPLDGLEARQLNIPGEASWPFWSSDGSQLGYFDQSTGRLMKVPIDGGRAAEVGEAPNGRGGTWNANDVIVFAPAPAGPLMRVQASGGKAEAVTRVDSARGETAHRFPCFLPDGRHFTYAALPKSPDGNFDIYVGSLEGGEPVHLMRAETAPVYAAPGYLLFRRGGQVMARRFDPGRRVLEGEPVMVADAPEQSDLDADPVASASVNGRIALLGTGVTDNRVVHVGRAGATFRAFDLPPGAWTVFSVTRDQHRALLGNVQDLWFVDLERSVPTRYLSTGSTASAVMSPDGRRVAFVRNKDGREGIAVADLAGNIEFEIYPNDLYKSVYDWSPDGAYVVYGQLDPQRGYDILLLPTTGDHVPVEFLRGPNWESGASVSPDGRWIAYDVKEPSGTQIYVTSFPRPGLQVKVTRDGGTSASWGRGGRELYYVSGRTLNVVPMSAGDEPRPGTPRPLFELDGGLVGGAALQDGDSFLMAISQPRDRQIRLVLNWTTLVER